MSATQRVVNPSDGSVLAEVAMAGEKEVELAVTAATRAFPAWSALSPEDCGLVLHRFADGLEEHAVELAHIESLDVRKAITLAEGFDVPIWIECFRYIADLSTHTEYSVPLNVKGFEARS